MTNYLISALLVVIIAATASAEDKPSFKITTKRDNDIVEFRAEKEKTVFIVKSPFGISHATIERTGEKWPDAVVLRLHLKGLENFRVTNDKVKIEVSVPSHDGKARLWKDGKEDEPLDVQSPYWMEIRMIGGDGKPAKVIPLKDPFEGGYFEMVLPKGVTETGGQMHQLRIFCLYF